MFTGSRTPIFLSVLLTFTPHSVVGNLLVASREFSEGDFVAVWVGDFKSEIGKNDRFLRLDTGPFSRLRKKFADAVSVFVTGSHQRLRCVPASS